MVAFISYSRANSDFATRLTEDLKAAGHDIWFDQFNIPTGSRWDDEIEKALRSCAVFLLILSPASMQSQNVKDEVGYAIDAGKHILPVMIEPCDIPFRLRRFQFVNFIDRSYEESLAEIGDLLVQAEKPQPKLDSTDKPAAAKRPPAPTEKKSTIGGDQNIIQGNVSGGIVVQGRNAKVTVNQSSGVDAGEIAALFEKLYRQVETRPDDPNVDKSEIVETLQKLEEESAKGDEANEAKLGRWAENLGRMAPDILDVALASLGGPVSGFTAVFKKIADHARQQSKQ